MRRWLPVLLLLAAVHPARLEAEPPQAATAVMAQNIDVRNYSPAADDWGPALKAAYADALAQRLPLWIPPGTHNLATPLIWLGRWQPIIHAEGATLRWTGKGTAVTIGAPSGQRVVGFSLSGLAIENVGDAGSKGLVLQNVCYSQLRDLTVSDFGVNLSLVAHGEGCGYLDFWHLSLARGQIGIEAQCVVGADADVGKPWMNKLSFWGGAITGPSETDIRILPSPKWPPSLWTWHDGAFETGTALIDASACQIDFDQCYFETATPLTVTAPAGAVTFDRCRGIGVVGAKQGRWSGTN